MDATDCLLDASSLPSGVVLRPARLGDVAAIAQLHARVFGPGRFARTAYRVREQTPDISVYCHLLLVDGELVAALRMTPITIGGRAGAAMLGPLAVDPAQQRKTFGRRLIAAGLEAARVAGLELVVLVGDLDYYGPLGFERVGAGSIRLPGPVDPRRVLACPLADGALAKFAGLIAADNDARHWVG